MTRIDRRSFLRFGGLAGLGAAVSGCGWDGLLEGRELARLPSPRDDAPNVLLIVLDTVRAQNLSLYGYGRRTAPYLEQLAGAGVVFERAIAPSPWTLPTHATLFTGRHHHELSADWKAPLDDTYPTLAEVLAKQGYHTAGFVANTVYCSSAHGLDRGFVHYEDYDISAEEVLLSSNLGRTVANSRAVRKLFRYHDILTRKTAEEINGDFLRWVSRHGSGPFFAFLNYFDAHEPYLPPEPFDTLFGPTSGRDLAPYEHGLRNAQRWDRITLPPEELQQELNAYDGVIAYLDAQVALLLAELRTRGLLQDTLVIILSDHGEHFGEHDLFAHGNSLYRQLLHVPLLIWYPPRVPAGRRISEPVTLRDLPATILDLVGLHDGADLPGASLVPHWQSPANPAWDVGQPLLSEVSGYPGHIERYPIAKGDMKSLVFEGYHYILNGDGREELYDFESDLWEERDLAASEEGRRSLERFRESLEKIVGR